MPRAKSGTNGTSTSSNHNSKPQQTALSSGPILQFEFIQRRDSKSYSLDTRVLTLLTQYQDFVATVIGNKPTEDMVVEQALRYSFEKDAGFQKYLKNLNAQSVPKEKPAPVVTPDANASAVPSIASPGTNPGTNPVQKPTTLAASAKGL